MGVWEWHVILALALIILGNSRIDDHSQGIASTLQTCLDIDRILPKGILSVEYFHIIQVNIRVSIDPFED